MKRMVQDKKQRACGKIVGLLDRKQAVNSIVSGTLCGLRKVIQGMQQHRNLLKNLKNPVGRTCLQARRMQAPTAIANVSILRTRLKSVTCLLWSSPEGKDISKSSDRALRSLINLNYPWQVSAGISTHTWPWALSQTCRFSHFVSYPVSVFVHEPVS